MPRLIVIRGVDEGKQFELTAPTVSVGRHSANTVSLHDTQVSRRHLELHVSGTGYELVDLGSGNGTLLNGSLVETTPIADGDLIQIGPFMLRPTYKDGGLAIEVGMTIKPLPIEAVVHHVMMLILERLEGQ